MKILTKKTTALVLGGGGARGLCHIGVLRALEEEFDKFPFDYIIGTSMGALIASAYVSGTTCDELELFVRKFATKNLLNLKFSPTGIFNSKHLSKVIEQLVKKGPAKHNIGITATDLISGESCFFRLMKGEEYNIQTWRKLVLASCSVPGIYPPIEYYTQPNVKQLLVDGGLAANIPTYIAKKIFNAKKIIAVNPGYAVTNKEPKNLIGIMWKALQITEDKLNDYQCINANIVIEPELEGITQFQFYRAKTIIEQGKLATFKLIKKIKRMAK